MDTPQITVVGSHGPSIFVQVRRIPIAGETVAGWGMEAPPDGGKGTNQAVAAARLGARVRFVGCIGDDALGDDSLGWLAQANVDTTFVRRTSRGATLGGLVLVDESRLPAIVAVPGANAELTASDVDRAFSDANEGGVLITQFEIPLAVALYASQRGRQAGLLTIVNPSPVPEVERLDLSVADILVPNETEALALLGRPPNTRLDPDALAAQVWERTGAGCVLVTLGERGVVYAGPDGTWQEAAPRVPVVDTTGAGDAFCGALAVELGRGSALRSAAKWACAAAAYSVTQFGTIPIFPTAVQVAAFLAERQAV